MATMTTDQHIPVALATFAKDEVTPEPHDGPIIWASSDETVIKANITDVVTGETGFVESVAPGTARMTWTATPVGGGPVITLVSEDVIVTMGVQPATIMKVTLGAPVAK